MVSHDLAATLEDWRRTRLFLSVEETVFALGADLAEQRGWVHARDGGGAPCPDNEDVERALREAYPVAAVIAALCDRLAIAPPGIVRRAMDDGEPLPVLS